MKAFVLGLFVALMALVAPTASYAQELRIGQLPALEDATQATTGQKLSVQSSSMVDGWPLHAAVAFEIIASGVDGYTTMYLDGQDSVRAPRTAEVSPVLAPFSNQPITMAVMKTGIAVAVGWLLIKYHAENPRLAFWTAAILGGVYTWAGIHNQKLIASVNQ